MYNVQSYHNHPNYNSSTNVNDISIIKTTKSIAFNNGVGPVCLPLTAYNRIVFKIKVRSNYNLFNRILNTFTGSIVEAVGWDATGYGYPESKTLRKVGLNVISNAQCNNDYGTIQPSQLCTYTKGRDTCQVMNLLHLIFE